MTSAPQTSTTLRPPSLGSPATNVRPGKHMTTVSPSPHTPRLVEGPPQPFSPQCMPPHNSWQEPTLPLREVLARQTFTAVFEGFRQHASRLYPARPGQAVAVFKVIRSHRYERTGLYADQELPEGSEFVMDSVQASPDIQERVKSLNPGTIVHITYQHSHLEVAGERYPVPERLVMQLSVSEQMTPTAPAEPTLPWRAISSQSAPSAMAEPAQHWQAMSSPRAPSTLAEPPLPWQAMPSSVAPDRFGTAVVEYGIQLKSWVDHQVEICLGDLLAPWRQQLQGFDGQVVAAREGLVSVEAQLKNTQADTHRRLDAVMEELTAMRASISEHRASNSAMLESESGSWDLQLREMHRKHKEQETLMSRLQQKHLDLEKSHQDLSGSLSQHQREHSDGIVKVWREFEIHKDRVQEMETVTKMRVRELDESHLEKANKLEAAHFTQQETFSQTHNRLSALEEMFDGFTNQHGELESNLSALFDAHLGKHSLALTVESLQQKLEENRLEVLSRLSNIQALSTESLEAAMESLQARTAEKLEELQVKLMRKFRAELTAAFRSEADAVASLDNQMWQKAHSDSRRLVYDQTDHLFLTPTSSPIHNKGRASPGAKLGLLSMESGSAGRLASRVDNWS